jgi:hypothetical protein
MKYGWGNSVRGVEEGIFVRIRLFDMNGRRGDKETERPEDEQ